jgi:hypothetical protein
VFHVLGGGGFILLLYRSEVFHGSHVALFTRWCRGRVPCWFCGRIFLAGTGAIAGAIIGGVADLREFFRRKDQAPREAQDRDKSE